MGSRDEEKSSPDTDGLFAHLEQEMASTWRRVRRYEQLHGYRWPLLGAVTLLCAVGVIALLSVSVWLSFACFVALSVCSLHVVNHLRARFPSWWSSQGARRPPWENHPRR